MRPFIAIFFLSSILFLRCSEDEQEPSHEEIIFPAESDVIGFWKLSKVYLDDAEVSFDNRSQDMINEYFRLSSDMSWQDVLQYSGGHNAVSDHWELNEDLLNIGGLHGLFYKVQSFSDTKLVFSPNARQNLKFEYVPMNEEDFPEIAFSATVSGKAWSNTSTSAYNHGSTMQVNANTNEFFIAISIPTDAQTGQQYLRSETDFDFGALVLKNDTDYGIQKGGIVKVIKRTQDYLHIEFQFTVQMNSGNEEITVTNGTIRTMLPQ